ncbi:outer membrane protein Iml2/Tetratricopeptide repeat protein 39 [Dipodascopsis uninucleata]
MVKPVSWLRGKTSSSKSSEPLNAKSEAQSLIKSLEAMDCIMADDLVQAKKILSDQANKSSFSLLGKGVLTFIEATLGFEADVIKDATEKLHKADVSASSDRVKAQKSGFCQSSYGSGTEYYLAMAEAHLMGAVVLFLNESAIGSIKGFYKLRRAYQILADIHDHDMSEHSPNLEDDDGSSEFQDEEEAALEESLKKLEEVDLEKDFPVEAVDNNTVRSSQPERKYIPLMKRQNMSPTDEYIQSGVNLCFGLLQLVISMIPPVLGRILSIIGFRGDLEASLHMLWEASTSENIHGALALLTLLLYYTGPAQVCDIEQTGDAFPRERLTTALAKTRKRYPKSALWILQEARMQGITGDLRQSIATLEQPVKIQMRQIEALIEFEKAMCYLDLHDFEKSAKSFLLLTTLNTWSHALYNYVAGVCYVELYRSAVREENPSEAKIKKFRKIAEELLSKAPTLIGKRKLIGRAMPLEIYLQRKVRKWATRASRLPSVSFIDCIGTSPANEIIYFWNGFKRMPREGLEKSLCELSYHYVKNPTTVSPSNISNNSQFYEKQASKFAFLKDVDECGVKSLLESIVLRNMGFSDQGLKLLEDEVLPIQRASLKGNEDWIPPCALYERGVFEWFISGSEGAAEIHNWLSKAALCGYDYELSTRIGVRIQTGIETVKNIEAAKKVE